MTLKNISVLSCKILSILFLFFLIGCSKKDKNYNIEIDNINSKQEILESSVPVVVIFCDQKLWNRKSVSWTRKKPSSIIMAVKEIIREGKYSDKIIFWKYIVPDDSYNRTTRSFDKNPLCREFNIKYLPTVIIFRSGDIFEKFEGGGCTMDKSKTKIMQALKKVGEINATFKND